MRALPVVIVATLLAGCSGNQPAAKHPSNWVKQGGSDLGISVWKDTAGCYWLVDYSEYMHPLNRSTGKVTPSVAPDPAPSVQWCDTVTVFATPSGTIGEIKYYDH